MQRPKSEVKTCKFCDKPLPIDWTGRSTRQYCDNAHRAAYYRQRHARPIDAQDAKRHARKAERAGQLPEGFTALLDDMQQLQPRLTGLAGTPADLETTLEALSLFLKNGDAKGQALLLQIFTNEAKGLAELLRTLADVVDGIQERAVDVVCMDAAADAELDALLYPAQINYAHQTDAQDDDQDDDDEFHDA